MCLLSTMSANFFSPMARQLRMGKGLLFVEAPPSHSVRHTTLGRSPLDEWSAWRRDFNLTRHNIQKIHTSMPPAGFEPALPASERPQTHALVRAATDTGQGVQIHSLKSLSKFVAFYLYRQQVDRVKTRDCNKGRAAVLHAGTCSRPSRRDVQLPFTQWNWPSATDILWKQGMAWRIKFYLHVFEYHIRSPET